MSLKVWLPLNGDLHNQGCSNASVTNTSAVINTAGKIGSCYSFGTAKSYLKFDNMDFIHNFTECSVSLWIKILSWNTSYATYFQFGLGSTPWAHYIFGLLRNNAASTLCFTISNGSSATNAGCLTPALELNTWYHLTLTYTAGHCKIYVNGVQTNDYSTNIVPNFAGITTGTIGVANNLTGYQTNCLINDFRIYDHCLSTVEAKEIAQGLVLHYKLDRKNLRPIGTNLVTGVTKGGQTSLLTDGRIGVVTSGTSADTYFTVNLSENITNGTTYYLSCDVSGVSPGQYWGFPLGAQNNTSMPSKFYNGHNEYIFTANDINWGTNRLFLDDNYRNDYAHPASFYNFVLIKNPTFEAIDESGYGYNSISNAPITSSTDTPRYNEASYFGAYNTPNLILINPATLLPTLSNCTITWWGKYDTAKTLLLTGHTTGHYLAASDNNTYYHRNAGTITFYKDGVAGTYKCAVDGWHFFAMTGVNISSWTALKLNGYSSDWPLKGYISDLRIYCTALLDSDIKQLYNVGMKIDKEQSIHTYELQEENINLFSAIPWTSPYSIHALSSSLFSNFNEYGELQFTTNGSSAGSDYIIITPGTYEYDYTVSINAGNQFYIGFERYDADKTSRSNAACVYTYATKPSSDVVKQRYKGTVNLSTDGVNPIKYIALRILNGWSGTTSGVTGQATIHNFSLRLQSSASNPQITKTGQFIVSELKQDMKASFYKDHIVEAAEFIER